MRAQCECVSEGTATKASVNETPFKNETQRRKSTHIKHKDSRKSRAEQSRAGQSRAEQSRVEQRNLMPRAQCTRSE